VPNKNIFIFKTATWRVGGLEFYFEGEGSPEGKHYDLTTISVIWRVTGHR
jgi:hypothetical protein